MPSRKIKVLKFITHFGIGGTERQFVYITKGLDRARFDVRVGCMARMGTFMKDVEAANVPISEYKTRSLYSYKTVQKQMELARDIRRDGIELIHAYGFYPNVFSIPAAALGSRCITIASVRDMGSFSNRHAMRRLAQSLACRFADCVVANSNAVREWLWKQGLGRCDIRVIPNGITIPTSRNPREGCPVRDHFHIDRKAPVIAVIGRLIRTKGIEYFLDAAAGIAGRFPSARFLIVGEACAEPPYRTELEQRTERLNLTGRVIFAGERTDVPRILREIDIAVQPSLTESFSNSLLESMAHGLPVVATNAGGNPELVDDGVNGLLVPPRNGAALARAMTRLLESEPLARRLGQAAREKVIKEYSLDTLLSRTEGLYAALVGRRENSLYMRVRA